MVDGARIADRLRHLDELLDELDAVRAAGRTAYALSRPVRRQTLHDLQIAIQTCIDVSAHLIAELGLGTPRDYADVFVRLAERSVLERPRAERLADAARLRSLLVHEYHRVDEDRIFELLGELDDLRAFAAAALRASRSGG